MYEYATFVLVIITGFKLVLDCPVLEPLCLFQLYFFQVLGLIVVFILFFYLSLQIAAGIGYYSR